MMDLRGRVALVTGGGSGIGRATVERFVAEEMRVCVVDIDERAGREVADAAGGLFVAADAGDPEQVEAAFARCVAELGALDVAFINAGIAIGHADLATLPDDVYRRIMHVNVDGVVFGTRADPHDGAAGRWRDRCHRIARRPHPFPPDPVYDATKHAVVGLIRSIAPLLEPQGITANCVNPGMTDTNIMGDEIRAVLAAAEFPLMQPSQIADAVVHAITCGETGRCWVCQPGREPIAYEFRDVPGPRTSGTESRVPPGLRDGTLYDVPAADSGD